MFPRFITLLTALVISIGCNHGQEVSVKDGFILLEGKKVGSFSDVNTPSIKTRDKYRICKDGVVELHRTFTALEDIDSARLDISFKHESTASFSMIPAVCYNGNQWGRGNEPKGFVTDGTCHSYSCRRTSVPGATYSEGKEFAVAMWGQAPQDESDVFACSILPEEGCVTHSLIFPEEEMPFVYDRRDGYSEGRARKMSLKKGESFRAIAFLSVASVKPDHGSIGDFLDKVWARVDNADFAPKPDDEEVWKRGISYVKESLWAEEGPYKGFSIGLTPKDGKFIQRPGWKYEIGWCGQNASIANALLTDFLKTGDSTSLKKALVTLETWSSPQTVLPNGLYITNYDYLLKGNENPKLDACNLGTAALMFFESSDLLRKCGCGDPEKLESIALGILRFAMEDQQEDGCYARGWFADGTVIVREGTVGAFLIAPMVEEYARTGDERFLRSAEKAFKFYYGELCKDGFTTAGALDTWCIDKESSMPLIQSALMLYDATSDISYVDAAEHVAYYLTTWMCHQKEVYPSDSDFSIHGYNTFGATAVSVQHHHLDPYAIKYVPDLMKLSRLTGKSEWADRAMAIWNNGCQLISDGTLEIHGMTRPVGSQNEAFLHCNWGWQGDPGKDRLNDWLVSWPGAFRLEALRRMAKD